MSCRCDRVVQGGGETASTDPSCLLMAMVGLSESRWTVIFTDDVVICGETRELRGGGGVLPCEGQE